MTNEEAKEVFLNRGFVNGIFDGDKWRQSIVVISKWLEQEPCEDCISRKAVLAIAGDSCLDLDSYEDTREFCDEIKELPPVTPKPKTECSCEQIKWERDIAIEQLHELGYELGQKIEPCEDCINRAELLKAVDTWDKFGCDADSKLVPYKDCYVPYIHYDDVVKAIKGMPSIQPKTNEPLQVDLDGDGYADGKLVYDYGKCPKCGWEFEYGEKDWEEPYCCHCGQKLHWFESEEQE